MKKRKPRVAYIEHTGHFKALVVELRNYCGVKVFEARDLEGFLEQHGSLDNFPCLLYHPGASQQEKIIKIREDYPNLNIGIFIGGTKSVYDPAIIHNKGVDFLMCDAKDIVKWVREHQQARASPQASEEER